MKGQSSLKGPGSSTWYASGPNVCRLRILIVEDDGIAANALAELLKSDGNEVAVATDGIAGLQATEAGTPDVVLLDLGLPGMDGYEVCKRIREQEHKKRPLLIAVTGHGQKEDRIRSYESGIDLHLTKPVDIHELRHVLGRFRTIVSPPSEE